MKKTILSLIMCFSFAAQAQLVSKTFYGESAPDFKSEITKMFKDELKKESSNLKYALLGLAQESDLAFNRDADYDTDAGTMTVDLETHIFQMSGKSGSEIGSTYLIPIMADMFGTGMIREIIGFVVINYSLNMGGDSAEEHYSINRIVPFTTIY